jgi:hypothetical protein
MMVSLCSWPLSEEFIVPSTPWPPFCKTSMVLLLSLRDLSRQHLSRLAARNPRQVSIQDFDGERYKHESCTNPEAPVTVHAPPIRPWIRLARVAAIALRIVPVSGHFLSVPASKLPFEQSDSSSPGASATFSRSAQR